MQSSRENKRPGLFASNEVSGEELAYLLDPIPVETFVQEYFGKKALFIKGRPEKFAKLFGREAFEQAVTRMRPEITGPNGSLRASFAQGTKPNQSIGEKRTFSIQPDQARALFEAGASLCVDWISNASPRLKALAQSVKAQLKYPGYVRFNSYMSPDGRGFDTHFDARIATTLQIEGSKVWRYCTTATVDWPIHNGFLQSDGTVRYPDVDFMMERTTRESSDWERGKPTKPEDFEEVLLEPGDVLILPAGAWHAARAEGHSLALNMTLEPFPLADLLHDVIRTAFMEKPEWRSAPPYMALEDRAALKEYLDARLDDVRDLFAKLSADDMDLLRPWGRNVADEETSGERGTTLMSPKKKPSEVQAKRGSRPPPVPRGPLTHDDLLVLMGVNATCVRGKARDGKPTLTLFVGETEVDVHGSVIDLVEQMVKTRRFRAGDAERWSTLGWSETASALELFIESGILRRIET